MGWTLFDYEGKLAMELPGEWWPEQDRPVEQHRLYVSRKVKSADVPYLLGQAALDCLGNCCRFYDPTRTYRYIITDTKDGSWDEVVITRKVRKPVLRSWEREYYSYQWQVGAWRRVPKERD